MGNRFSFLSEHKSFASPRGWVLGFSKREGRREGEDERERRVGQADMDAALA